MRIAYLLARFWFGSMETVLDATGSQASIPASVLGTAASPTI